MKWSSTTRVKNFSIIKASQGLLIEYCTLRTINQRLSQSHTHTGEEKPHPSTTTGGGSKLCGTK